MTEINGVAASKGIAIGPLYYYEKIEQTVLNTTVTDISTETERFYNARDTAIAELNELYKRTSKVSEDAAGIFEIHSMMLEDEDFIDAVAQRIKNDKMNASWAVSEAAIEFKQMLADVDDEYISGRAADVNDIADRLIKILDLKTDVKTQDNSEILFDEPVIIVAKDLLPSETILFDRTKILAFVTTDGSVSSHTAILARSLNIPAVLATGYSFTAENNGVQCIVDGEKAVAFLSPTASILENMRRQQVLLQEKNDALKTLRGTESITSKGKKINLFANVGSLEDIDFALENDAEGIGLFRSEFLYLGKKNLPTETEIFDIYRQATKKLQGKKLIIRTLDIGADKQIEYLTSIWNLKKEENPALGMRAIRICLTQPAVFITQLRGILRASAFGKIAIMFPMIISVDEVKQIHAILLKVKDSLRKEQHSFDEHIEIGIMIETPAAALIADELATTVDFFSIGTNDLTQYTLAVDRQNNQVASFCNPHHKAVLKLIEMTVAAARKHQIWTGLCGELGADTELTQTFIDMGIDELSVNSAEILPLRKKIQECN